MKKVVLGVLPIVFLLSACDTYITPRYSINADANVALKTLGTGSVAVGSFTGPDKFDSSCRMAGPLELPDGMNHAAYIKKALEDELKVAGAYAATAPKASLTGVIKKLEFSSSRGLTNGTWDIELTVNSSNGKSMAIAERYDFTSGFAAITACKQTAEAFMPAVQNLIGKLVQSPDFKTLVQ